MQPRVAFRRSGEGAPHRLLLLHGIGSNSRSFQPQLDRLGTDFDVVAWDAPGYGQSDDPPSAYTMADFADAATGLLDKLGWPNAHVLGHSFGGVVAQFVYQRHPERVSSLILADTNPGSGTLPEPERSARVQRRLRDLETLTARQMAEQRAPNLVTPEASAGLVEQLVEIMAEIRPAGYAAAAVAMGTADTRAWLGEIAVPTLVIHGERDTIIPLSTAVQLAAAIPAAHMVIIPYAGHASNQQSPEAYNEAIREFIRSLE